MTSLPARLVGTTVAIAVLVTPVHAQKPWERPEPPCELDAGHRFVNGAILQLKQGVEAEDDESRQSRFIEARNLLLEAITDAGQGDNPATWYYLGRYYAEVQDAAGADSAFRRAREMVPGCAEDIGRYLPRLSAVAMNDAALAWNGRQIDSAAALFRLAFALDSSNANALLFLSSMYSSDGQLDSASKYAELGSQAAGDDPAFRNRRQRAMLDLLRGYAGIATQEPAIGRAAPARHTRDSIQVVIERDSTILANLIAEWAGRRLRPEVQARVQRDSTRVARRLSQARSALTAAVQAAADDSAAAGRALQPVIKAYSSYVETFTDDHDALIKLIGFHAATGNREGMDAMIDRLSAAEGLQPAVLLQTGLDLLNGSHDYGSARVMEALLQENPYHRDALYMLARATYRLRDGERLVDATRRLSAIDPMNQESVRMTAGSWELAGNLDSARHYVDLANGGMGWSVRVVQFLPSETSITLNGTVQNISKTAREPVTLAFEFLGANGDVVGSATSAVPALPPGAQHNISIQVPGGGAVAWRYTRGGG